MPHASDAGDFVDLRAEMNLVLVLSNCAHPLDPAPAGRDRVGHADPPSRADCRPPTTRAAPRRPRSARAFTFTDRLYA